MNSIEKCHLCIFAEKETGNIQACTNINLQKYQKGTQNIQFTKFTCDFKNHLWDCINEDPLQKICTVILINRNGRFA